MSRALVVVMVLASALTAGATPAGAEPQSRDGATGDRRPASPARVLSDFNGDHLRDIAVGAPGEDVGALVDAGAVNIYWGTAAGAFLSVPHTIVQNHPEAGDRFGAALTSERALLGGDAIDDLVVGAPGEDVGAKKDAGAVNIFVGVAAGVPRFRATVLQNTAEAGDRFGAALTTGHIMDRSGILVVGAPGEDVAGRLDAGAATVFGISEQRQVIVETVQALFQNKPEAGDHFGASLATGFLRDRRRSGWEDLVVGVPGENVDTVVDAGAVNIVSFDATSRRFIFSTPTLLQGRPEAGDRFGVALRTTDSPRSIYREDLVVGVPGENVAAKVDAGAVAVFEAGVGRRGARAPRTLLQDNPEAGDRLGAALVLVGTAGIVAGAPGEDVGANVDAGAVNVFGFTSTLALPAVSTQTLLQNNPEAGDRFGAALASPLLAGDEPADLVVGVPGETVSGAAQAGAANVFVNTTGPLPNISGQTLLQDRPSAGDRLGATFQT